MGITITNANALEAQIGTNNVDEPGTDPKSIELYAPDDEDTTLILPIQVLAAAQAATPTDEEILLAAQQLSKFKAKNYGHFADLVHAAREKDKTKVAEAHALILNDRRFCMDECKKRKGYFDDFIEETPTSRAIKSAVITAVEKYVKGKGLLMEVILDTNVIAQVAD